MTLMKIADFDRSLLWLPDTPHYYDKLQALCGSLHRRGAVT